jgi:hypothetical protein
MALAMRRVAVAAMLLLATCWPTVFGAQAATPPPIAVLHPWSRATPPGVTVGVGYLEIVNNGPADRLVGVSSPFAERVEIHDSALQGGMMVMREITDLPIAARSRTVFAPTHLHLMLVGLKTPLVAEARVPVTLVFKHAGGVTVELLVTDERSR